MRRLALLLALHPFGLAVASEPQDLLLQLTRAQDGQTRPRYGFGPEYERRSPDGRWAATVDPVESPAQTNVPQYIPGSHLQLWDLQTGKAVWANREKPKPQPFAFGDGSVHMLCFSPDGRLLLWREVDGRLRQLDTRTRTERPPLQAADLDGIAACSPDGRTLALVGPGDERLRFIDLHTGGERLRRDLSQRVGADLAFTSDGRSLTAGFATSTPLIENVSSLVGAKTAPEADWPRLWDELAEDDVRAFRAVRSLALSPASLGWLEERLRTHAPLATPERIERLIADLDDEEYAVRQRATQELRRLRVDARRAMLRARETHPPLEMLRRLDELLADPELTTPSGWTLQGLRGVEALEAMSTPEARRALRRLAAEAQDENVRREATETVQRLK
jgi:hypothetical protein